MVRTGMAFLAAIVLAATTPDVAAQSRGGRGGRGGGFGDVSPEMQARMSALRVLPLEMMWSALSIGVEMPDDQVVRLLPAVRRAWKERVRILAFAQKNEAWEMASDRLKDLRKRVDAEVRSTLTDDQWKAYEKQLKEARKASMGMGVPPVRR